MLNSHHAQTRHRSLRDVAWLFLKLGTIAFGGPAAHIAMMEDEVVRRRGWLKREEFLDLVGATNLIPGPNSTELAIHIGYRRAGWLGLLAAGGCFILPAALIVMGIAWVYVRYGKLPQAEAILYGIKPVMIAIVAQALWALGCTAVKTGVLAGLGVLLLVATAVGVNELLVLLCGGLTMAAWARADTKTCCYLPLLGMSPVMPAMGAATATSVAASTSFSLPLMFLFFLKVGSVLFGSGYVLLAFLRADLVQRWHWLTESQLLDAIAVGQMTPGPVFTTATFIGYVLGDFAGATVATVGIFLPAFVFVALSAPLLPRIRRSRIAGGFLDGVNVASLALMALVTWNLGVAAIVDWVTVTIAVVALMLLVRFRINSAWLLLGGACCGWINEYVLRS